jgi:hypothetical protein
VKFAPFYFCLGLGLLTAQPTAHAHSWYDPECCHEMDCAPVTSSAYIAGASYDAAGQPIANALPRLIVTTRMGTAMVPPDMKRRMSHDGQMHACIRSDGTAGMRVICIYVPPTN